MKLDRIPPRMLLVLGLAPGCGPTIGDDDTTVADTGDGDSTRGPGPTSGMTSTSPSTSSPSTTGNLDSSGVGPCLDVGPCLEPLPPDTTSTGDGTGGTLGPCLDIGPTTGTDSGGTDSGGTETFTPCLAPPGDEPAPDAPGTVATPSAHATHVRDRVLSSGRLPDDVAARLKRPR